LLPCVHKGNGPRESYRPENYCPPRLLWSCCPPLFEPSQNQPSPDRRERIRPAVRLGIVEDLPRDLKVPPVEVVTLLPQ